MYHSPDDIEKFILESVHKMASVLEETIPLEQRKIIILGAGYGGMAAAVSLQKHSVPFTLINKHSYHYFKTLLHEAAGGRSDVQTYAIELADVLSKNTSHVVKESITSIDLARQTVHTMDAVHPYDTLIVALGSQTACYGVPGLQEHSLVLNSLATARDVREHLEKTLLSYQKTGDASALKVVVGGAGLTGVELVGELADFIPHFLAKHQIQADDYELILVHSHDHILPGVDDRLRDVAEEKLVQRGVRLMLGEHVVGARSGEIELQSGAHLYARTFIWTGGVEANPLLRQSGFSVDERGRASVNAYLQSIEHPQVYVVGDAARLDDQEGNSLPPTGQVAEQMGQHVGENLIRILQGQTMEPFRFHNHGMVASLGPTFGVAEVGRHHATGRTALMLKDGSKMKYLMHLGGAHVLLEKRKQWIDI